MAPQKYKMRCHYDVLEVSRDASDGELKKAYRRLALEWHPDKNQHRLEEAEGRFKEVRAAYETLSDPNERAWYDSHREAILRSGVHAAGGEDARPEDELNLMPFFTSAAFRGFGDEPGSFYAVYGDLFGQIDAPSKPPASRRGRTASPTRPLSAPRTRRGRRFASFTRTGVSSPPSRRSRGRTSTTSPRRKTAKFAA